MRGWLLLGCLVLGCGESQTPASPPEGARREGPTAAPAMPPAMPLTEALYAGELGPQSAAAGDRVRILLWLRGLELDEAALESMRQAALRVQAAEAAADAARVQMGEAEAERLKPIYEGLAAQLATGSPTEAEAAALADSLQQARAGLPDPRRARAEWVQGALDEAEKWSSALDEHQRRGMANALFFLRREVSADARPGLLRELLGEPWQPGDFSSLRRSRSGEQGQLDVGGLFTLDGGSQDITENLDGLKLTTLVAIALSHPGLVPAIEVMQGRRAPTDGL